MSGADWPMQDPPNTACFTTATILDGSDWVGMVTHDEDDGAWQFLPYRGVDESTVGKLVALRNMLDRDPTLLEPATTLDYGERAWRESLDSPWRYQRRTDATAP